MLGGMLGTLEKGASADVTVFDPDEEWTVDAASFASKGKNTPLVGMRLRGKVAYTIAAGRIAYAAEGREKTTSEIQSQRVTR